MTGQFITLGSKYSNKKFNYLPRVLLKENDSGVVVLDIFNDKDEFVNSVILERELMSVNLVIEIAAYQNGITKSTLRQWRNHEFTSGSPKSSGLLKITLSDSSVVITVSNVYFADKMFEMLKSNKSADFDSTDSGDVLSNVRRK